MKNMTLNVKKIKATKKDISSVIRATSSRYNEYSKEDVVKEILFLVERGRDIETNYEFGVYHPSGANYVIFLCIRGKAWGKYFKRNWDGSNFGICY